jgi:hypothetical protein
VSTGESTRTGEPTRTWRCTPGAFENALAEFHRLGGTTQGGGSEGTVSVATPLGPLEARYLFDGEELTITLTSKPPMLPVGMIWSRLDQVCGPPVMKA